MPLTPETLPRHELVGLRVAVVDAPNPDLVGTCGRVVRETTRTLHVAPAPRGGAGAAEQRGQSRVVPKSGTTFEFALYERASGHARKRASGHATDEAAADRKAAGTASELPSETAGSGDDPGAGQSGGCEGVAYVTVDGARLLSRPARRTETGGIPTWR